MSNLALAPDLQVAKQVAPVDANNPGESYLPSLRIPSASIIPEESRKEARDLIMLTESAMAVDDARESIPCHINHFADGMYARELSMPAGMIITSKVHKTNHFCFVMQGSALVFDEFSGVELVVAPRMIVTKAGTKRILKILEDSIWITTHATEETDVNVIENEIIEGAGV